MSKKGLRISIRYKLFLVITALIVFMTATIGTVIIKRQKSQHVEQLTQFGKYVTAYLAQTSPEALLVGDDLAMSLLVRDIARIPQVTQVIIVDKGGIIRAHKDMSYVGEPYIPPQGNDPGTKIDSITLRQLKHDEETFLEFSSPISYHKMTVGKVYLNLTQKLIDQAIEKATWFVIILTVGLIIIGAMVSYILSMVLLRPIRLLVQGSREIAKGNFDHHVTVLRSDEMGDLAEAFNNMANELRLKLVIQESFGRYVSPDIVSLILNNPDQVWMMGQKQEVSLFFADIRGFTSLTEKKPPEELVAFLNDYFSMATEVIVRHRGYIDKFVGDEVMAVFGAPAVDPDHPIHAVKALLDLREGVTRFNQANGSKYNIQLKVGMGATVGQVIAGNIGSQTRMEYTVMGDNVNVANRLTEMAAPDEILISAELQERVASLIQSETVGPVQVKGREKWVMVYRVLGFKT